MKKIITTLTIVVAAALGAQGQTTIELPLSGTASLTGLTFAAPAPITPVSPYNKVRLYFGVDPLPAGVSVTLSGITLIGDGISSSLSIPDVTVNTDGDYSTGTSLVSLNSTVSTWNPANNQVSFNMQVNGGTLAFESSLTYLVNYYRTDFNSNFAFGNVNLVAVPEPSTYFAAAGLLGLCLWSARRQLFKLAGSRSTSSGSGSNGAA